MFNAEEITIRWTPPEADADCVTGYLVEQKSDVSGEWKRVAEGVKKTLYAVQGLTQKQSYQFRVRAMDEDEIGEPSDPSNLVAHPCSKFITIFILTKIPHECFVCIGVLSFFMTWFTYDIHIVCFWKR